MSGVLSRLTPVAGDPRAAHSLAKMIAAYPQNVIEANRRCYVGDSTSRAGVLRRTQSHHCPHATRDCMRARLQPGSCATDSTNFALSADLLLDETTVQDDGGSPVVATALTVLAQQPNLPPLEVLDRAMRTHSGEDLDFQFDSEIELAPPHPFAELIRRAFAPQLDLTEICLSLSGVQFEDREIHSRIVRARRCWDQAIRRFAERYRIWEPEP